MVRSKLKEVWLAGWSARFISELCRLGGTAGGWAYARTSVAERSVGSRSVRRRVVILASFLLDTDFRPELWRMGRKWPRVFGVFRGLIVKTPTAVPKPRHEQEADYDPEIDSLHHAFSLQASRRSN
jgi:hypothetical protein